MRQRIQIPTGGLRFWYDSSVVSSVILDGSTPDVQHGNVVRWEDLSGNGSHLQRHDDAGTGYWDPTRFAPVAGINPATGAYRTSQNGLHTVAFPVLNDGARVTGRYSRYLFNANRSPNRWGWTYATAGQTFFVVMKLVAFPPKTPVFAATMGNEPIIPKVTTSSTIMFGFVYADTSNPPTGTLTSRIERAGALVASTNVFSFARGSWYVLACRAHPHDSSLSKRIELNVNGTGWTSTNNLSGIRNQASTLDGYWALNASGVNDNVVNVDTGTNTPFTGQGGDGGLGAEYGEALGYAGVLDDATCARTIAALRTKWNI